MKENATKKPKPESEHAIMAVPPIVTPEEFNLVRARLTSRRSRQPLNGWPPLSPQKRSTRLPAPRRKLRDRSCGYRRDHFRALTQRVEVISKTEARIIGSRTELLRTLTSNSGVEAAAVDVLV
jgi:hypothetical protein